MNRSRNWGCRVSTDLTIRGYESIVLENAALRVCVLAEKGSDIVELLYKPKDLNLVSLSPNRLRRRGEISTSASATGNFFDNYEGGWQEIFPSGGPPCNYRGAELGQHGEVALLPWSWNVLVDQPEHVAVRFTVDTLRTPFRLEKTLHLRGNRAVLEIEERVTNLSTEAIEFMWGHHPMFGFPLIQEGTRISIPACQIIVPEVEIFKEQRLIPGFRGAWPRTEGKLGKTIDLSVIPGPDNRTADFCFLTSLDEARYQIHNRQREITLVVEWDYQVMSSLWYWQVCGGVPDWPWWGRLYAQALEPFTAPTWSLVEAIREEQQLRLNGGGSLCFYLNVTVV